MRIKFQNLTQHQKIDTFIFLLFVTWFKPFYRFRKSLTRKLLNAHNIRHFPSELHLEISKIRRQLLSRMLLCFYEWLRGHMYKNNWMMQFTWRWNGKTDSVKENRQSIKIKYLQIIFLSKHLLHLGFIRYYTRNPYNLLTQYLMYDNYLEFYHWEKINCPLISNDVDSMISTEIGMQFNITYGCLF